MDAIL